MWIARDRNIYTYPGEPWGLDNGVFRDWDRRGPFDPSDFDADLFRRVLDKAQGCPELPYLAVVPDAPGNAAGTLHMFDRWRPELPDFSWYIAVQDGMRPQDLEGIDIAGVFLGGTDEFKATAPMWREVARDLGVPFHYGRCGVAWKVRHAMEVGADSLDSAFPMWNRGRWRDFVECVVHGPPQFELF